MDNPLFSPMKRDWCGHLGDGDGTARRLGRGFLVFGVTAGTRSSRLGSDRPSRAEEGTSPAIPQQPTPRGHGASAGSMEVH